jgi:transcriptional regulator with XRE-family HTH domain
MDAIVKPDTISRMLESAQIRAARALLGWRQEDLSKASGVGTATIQRIEKSDRAVTGYASTLVRLQAAFEQAGIQFIDEDETGGLGLRMAKKKRKR